MTTVAADPDRLPIVYVRGYAGATAGIDQQVDDPFYGFNEGATHTRVDGDGDPRFLQFEGPLLRLLVDHGYHLPVHGDQRALLDASGPLLPRASLWVHRFYDPAATTFTPPRPESWLERLGDRARERVTVDRFDLEVAAADLYELIERVLARTGAPRVHLVAHSMGGLVARCMMQKVCGTPRAGGEGGAVPRRPARDVVDRLFTYGTPHGGIATDSGVLDGLMRHLGPAGADVFSRPLMYGYLTPGARFGDTPPDPERWDPRVLPETVFDVDDVFCLVGTDPVDYGPSRLVVGPRSDGLVRIENAYVRGAHRAFVHKSHSGRYGEVNSEEGYQNLRRFLFGRWAVALEVVGLAGAPAGRVSWQADVKLSVRGLPVLMSQQQADHWCPVILNPTRSRPAAGAARDDVDTPVPLVSTFLFDRAAQLGASGPGGDDGAADPAAAGLSRYVVGLAVSHVVDADGGFDLSDHLEAVPDWSDALVVDVGAAPDGGAEALGAWTAWNATLPGAADAVARMPDRLALAAGGPDGTRLVGTLALPEVARAVPVLGPGAALRVTVRDRWGKRG